MEIRNKQFQESKNFLDKNEDDDDDEEDEDEDAQNQLGGIKEPTARASMKQGGALIFQRKKEGYSVKLQDFVIMKMIGKGTFGKVYLVQNMHTRNIYAMKCIRKDIVIDNE